ncbi:MAG: hypothetical protein O2954_05855 [bacterium]|nr:hypothetical protein [bacterium]
MKLLAVAGDAGGARAIMPVISRLSSDLSVEFRAYAAAMDMWKEAGFQPGDASCLRLDGVHRIILGTTAGPLQHELNIIREAKSLDIRTVSVLDFWAHYRERFTTPEGVFVLPNAIAVMDEKAKEDMVAAEFPAECLHVTGQPAFDELVRYDLAEVRHQARKVLRCSVDCRTDETCILYASQPLSQLYSKAVLGFHEEDVLLGIVESLGRVLDRYSRRAVLLVKLHRREMNRPFTLPSSPSSNLRIRLIETDDIEPRELVVGSDLVVGMNSMMLMEACLLKKPVVSYQPDLKIDDPLPSNRLGWSLGVYCRAALDGALETELFSRPGREVRKRMLAKIPSMSGATERVVELLMAV